MLYIDSARAGEIAPLLETGLFRGVTTNPKLVAAAGLDPSSVAGLATELRGLGAAEVFCQTTGRDAATMMVSARRILRAGDFVRVKLPATREGLAVCRRLADEGIRALMTMVYHPLQVVLAHQAGAWGVAPYVGRMEDLGIDWRHGLAEMARLADEGGLVVLAASIRSRDMARGCVEAGAGSLTCGPRVWDSILTDPFTDAALDEFEGVLR